VLQDFEALREFHWNALFIGTMHFMDAYNYDLCRVQRCCIHYATPEGRLIPFCTYNSGPVYRSRSGKPSLNLRKTSNSPSYAGDEIPPSPQSFFSPRFGDALNGCCGRQRWWIGASTLVHTVVVVMWKHARAREGDCTVQQPSFRARAREVVICTRTRNIR